MPMHCLDTLTYRNTWKVEITTLEGQRGQAISPGNEAAAN